MRASLVVIFCLLAACASFSPDFEIAEEFAAPASVSGAAAEFAEAVVGGAADDASGFWLLSSSRSALESRAALFDAAVFTLDVQYFIWQDDPSGHFLLDRLLAAADRGVAVRLLVDDLSASGRDREFFALAEHENIAVRTFNPFRARSPAFQAMEFSTRFGTLNHRMHNKTIITDGRVGMIGGRNIGDRYFGIYDVFVQHDLDIMFVGAVLEDAIASFDEFWNAPLSIPVRDYLKPGRIDLDLAGLREFIAGSVADNQVRLSAFEFDAADWLQSQVSAAQVSTGRFVYDGADIDSDSAHRIKPDIDEFLAAAREEILISMAYFIPDEELMSLLEEAKRRGVRVLLLTNSVQSNNHMLAHVSYRRSRRRVLEAGIELHELRPDAGLLEEQAVAPTNPGYLGLHTKAIVIDRTHAMVTTANLDPRALDINTESAVMADAADLAEELRRQILDATAPVNAWRLELDAGGQVCWHGQVELRCDEPVRGPFQRVKQFLYVLMPFKNQA